MQCHVMSMVCNSAVQCKCLPGIMAHPILLAPGAWVRVIRSVDWKVPSPAKRILRELRTGGWVSCHGQAVIKHDIFPRYSMGQGLRGGLAGLAWLGFAGNAKTRHLAPGTCSECCAPCSVLRAREFSVLGLSVCLSVCDFSVRVRECVRGGCFSLDVCSGTLATVRLTQVTVVRCSGTYTANRPPSTTESICKIVLRLHREKRQASSANGWELPAPTERGKERKKERTATPGDGNV